MKVTGHGRIHQPHGGLVIQEDVARLHDVEGGLQAFIPAAHAADRFNHFQQVLHGQGLAAVQHALEGGASQLFTGDEPVPLGLGGLINGAQHRGGDSRPRAGFHQEFLHAHALRIVRFQQFQEHGTVHALLDGLVENPSPRAADERHQRVVSKVVGKVKHGQFRHQGGRRES